MHYYTYAYLREDKTPYYIGKGKDDRIYSTNRRINQPKDKSRIIYLKQNLTEEEAFRHEIYMIAVFGRNDLGTGILHNRTDGGEGVSGRILSQESRIKMSESGKVKIFSEEHRRKISEGNKNKIVSEETRRNLSKALKGKTRSEETRRKLSDANRGENHPMYNKTHSEEAKRKISVSNKGENNPNYGKIFSEEHRRKLSDAHKGKKWWNDGCGNTKFAAECPGNDWRLGRKKYIN